MCVCVCVSIIFFSFPITHLIYTYTHTHSDAAVVHCPADASQLPFFAEPDAKLVSRVVREGKVESTTVCMCVDGWV